MEVMREGALLREGVIMVDLNPEVTRFIAKQLRSECGGNCVVGGNGGCGEGDDEDEGEDDDGKRINKIS